MKQKPNGQEVLRSVSPEAQNERTEQWPPCHKSSGQMLIAMAALFLLSHSALAQGAETTTTTTTTCETRALLEALSYPPEGLEAAAGATNTGSVPTVCMQVLQARQALRRKRPQEAARLLQLAAPQLSEISPELGLLSAEAWLEAEAWTEARSALERLDSIPALRDHPKRYALWARLHQAEKNPARAVRALRQLLKLRVENEAELRSELVSTLLAASDASAAREEAVALMVRFPAHPETSKLASRLGLSLDTLTVPQRRKRITALVMAAQYVPAAREAEILLSAPFTTSLTESERDKIEKFAIEARVRAGQIEIALAHVQQLPSPASDAQERLRAWTYGKAGRLDDASRAWLTLSRQSSNPSMRSEACFFAAFAKYENNDLSEADALFSSCRPLLRNTSWEVAGLWYQALVAILRDQNTVAQTHLSQLVQHHPGHREHLKHQYWYARTLRAGSSAAAQRDEGHELLRVLADGDPTGYYGLLARQRLGMPPLLGASVPPDALAEVALHSPRAPTLRLLYELGFDEELDRTLKALTTNRANLGLAHLVEQAHRPWQVGARYIPHPQVRAGTLVRDAGWRASFAMPYRDLVRAHCQQHGISEAFAYAIMRTESGFSPRAKSPVGALGLLQLMPYTARGVAAHLQQPPPPSAALVQPATNIALGVAFLGLAEREFGHAAWAAAVYNGGPDNVARWMNQFGHLEPELFVERIPFQETRNYVKRVTETMAIYRALSGEPLRVELPATPPGKAPLVFTWFPPSEKSPAPLPGARAPEPTQAAVQ